MFSRSFARWHAIETGNADGISGSSCGIVFYFARNPLEYDNDHLMQAVLGPAYSGARL